MLSMRRVMQLPAASEESAPHAWQRFVPGSLTREVVGIAQQPVDVRLGGSRAIRVGVPRLVLPPSRRQQQRSGARSAEQQRTSAASLPTAAPSCVGRMCL